MEINSENSVLLIIDIQEKFRPVILGIDEVIANTCKLVKGSKISKIPIILMGQYPIGLGKTVSEIRAVLREHEYVEKTQFNCFNNPDFIKVIKKNQGKNLVVCGIEAHVCVLQTVLSALSECFSVHLVADAVSSRRKSDYDIALRRMEAEGVKLATSEMILFQMIKDCKDKNFKEISSIVKYI